MELIDYTGKLNNHKDYINALNYLEKKSQYIEYVLIFDDEEDELLKKHKDLIISMERNNKWWGTKSSRKSSVYKIKCDKELFRYLRNFETFCNSEKEFGEKTTEFGDNDIAFFDDAELPLLFTTTHEGYITIRDDLFSEI